MSLVEAQGQAAIPAAEHSLEHFARQVSPVEDLLQWAGHRNRHPDHSQAWWMRVSWVEEEH
jgi:hypothetical protein